MLYVGHFYKGVPVLGFFFTVLMMEELKIKLNKFL